MKNRNFTSEGWSEYRPGGLHPVIVGDCFDNWRQGDFVALKILVADAALAEREVKVMDKIRACKIEVPGRSHVVIVRERFLHQGPNGAHQCLVLPPMGPSVASLTNEADFITIPFEVDETRLSYDLARSILVQVVEGLGFMHRLGISHGDIQPGNILSSLRDLTKVDASLLRQQDGDSDSENDSVGFKRAQEDIKKTEAAKSSEHEATKPEVATMNGEHAASEVQKATVASASAQNGQGDGRWKKHMERSHSGEGRPKHLTYTEPLDHFANLDPHTIQVKLSDFGNSFFFDDPPLKPSVPLAFRAPELVVGDPITKEQDVWAFGCLAYELVVGFPLYPVLLSPFAPRKKLPNRTASGPDPLDTGPDDDHILAFNDILGTIPKYLRDKWPRSSIYFDEDGSVVNNTIGEKEAYYDPEYEAEDPVRIALRNNKPPEMSDTDVESLVDLLESIFKYDPAERAGLEEIAAHPWLQGTAAST